jgi:2-dehydro-3-deoxy-L-rhamnonate dehydrogenase (NAD+)
MDTLVVRTVLITGAAGDIGGAAASVLAAQGYSLVLADHPSASAKLSAKAAELAAAGSVVHQCTFDVTNRSDIATALGSLPAEVTISGLFNNAGYQGDFISIDRMRTDDVEKVMMINVVGVFNVISEVSSRMIAGGAAGAIVNTASMAGVGGAPNMAAYSASKGAVIAMTKSAAKDLAPAGIRVNAISPAFIGPGMMWDRQVELQANAGSQYYASTPAEVSGQMINMVPLRRYGSTTEVANVVAFLLSDAASYLTGVNIEISGGSA